MGELILCNRKETDVPYYLEQNMINIYSLEELNWYILNHAEYLDDSFVSDDLISWIAEELKDLELAGQLKEAVLLTARLTPGPASDGCMRLLHKERKR